MSFVSKMGRKHLVSLKEAAVRAKSEGLQIVQFVNQTGDYGYRVYGTSGRSAMSDCEPGWGVRYQGCYRAGHWIPGRTVSEQELISDPLAGAL